jgi:hypothetical protein
MEPALNEPVIFRNYAIIKDGLVLQWSRPSVPT